METDNNDLRKTYVVSAFVLKGEFLDIHMLKEKIADLVDESGCTLVYQRQSPGKLFIVSGDKDGEEGGRNER